MNKLTGFERFRITKHWLKGGMIGDLEKYVIKVCKAKGWEYVPVKKVKK